jgi:two-component system chemotaxis response regulator CheB
MESQFEIVVIGTSTGGLKALQVLLSGLPAEFPLPVVIVQHRGPSVESGLCEFLQKFCSLPVSEPEDKESVLPGRVYLAPRDYHLLLEDRSFALSIDPAVEYARPSIDVLFESAADVYQTRAIGLILTGANRDGARGLAAIKERGGTTVIEDPGTAASPEMPEAALAQTRPDWILPLPEIAPRLHLLGLAQRANERACAVVSEPRADRGPRTGSPRGMVEATGPELN